MAPTTSTQGRGATHVSVNNYRLFVLLFLVFAPQLLAAKDFVRKERNTNPASLGLKHGADSLINKDELEQVIKYLQDAVDEANKQKDDDIRSAVVLNELDTKLMAVNDQLQQLLMDPNMTSPADDLVKVYKRLVEKMRNYINLKKKSLTAEVDDMLKISDFQERFHTEL